MPTQSLKQEFTAAEAATYLSQKIGGFPIGITEIYLLTAVDFLPARYIFEGGYFVVMPDVKNPYELQSFVHKSHIPKGISDSASLLNTKNELTCFISSVDEPSRIRAKASRGVGLSNEEIDDFSPFGFLTEHRLTESGAYPLVINHITAEYLWLLAREKHLGAPQKPAPPVCVGGHGSENFRSIDDEDFSGEMLHGSHNFMCHYFELEEALKKSVDTQKSSFAIKVLEFNPTRLVYEGNALDWFLEQWSIDCEAGFGAIMAEYRYLYSPIIGQKSDWDLVKGERKSSQPVSLTSKTDNKQNQLIAVLAVALAGMPKRTEKGLYAGKTTYDQLLKCVDSAIAENLSTDCATADQLLDALPEQKTFRRYLDDGLRLLSLI